jgi:hypothetical protein
MHTAPHNLLMNPEGREFCFFIFSTFLISLTFFFASSIGSVVLFHGAIQGIGFSDRHVFSAKYEPKHEVWRFCRKPSGLNMNV